MVSVYDALKAIGWRPTSREPAGYRGPCPVHSSRSRMSRSMSCTPAHWYCWICQEGGDVIRLWARLRNCTDLQAALDLCAVFHQTVPRR